MKALFTMEKDIIPEFAVLGHPNEGKSSVVSTLTEDDQIRVSPVPGETKISSEYTVQIDGKSIIRFVDTPGFQVPQQTLAWFQAYTGRPSGIVSRFIDTFKDDPFYQDECELFMPVARGAGIVYVVDGSRPVREDDLAEIEILRLTGRPRMAVINSKASDKDYSSDWRHEFQKSFNAIRMFNANTADFKERIALLESLKPIDQNWESALSCVIDAFENDFKKRKQMVASQIAQTIETILSYSVSEPIVSGSDEQQALEKLNIRYQSHVKKLEQQMFQKIRTRFKHHLFDYQLPEYSILSHDLFSKKTWELLGLTQGQLAGAGALFGGSLGVVLDTATAGITFGVFTAIGGLIGAGSALFGGRKIAEKKPGGFRMGGNRLVVGPNRNLQFLYVLLDRALLYSAQIMQRAHGRRDLPDANPKNGSIKQGYSTGFSMEQKKTCARFFRQIRHQAVSKSHQAGNDFQQLIESIIDQMLER